MPTLRLLGELTGGSLYLDYVWGLGFSNNGRWAISASGCLQGQDIFGELKVWDGVTGEFLTEYDEPEFDFDPTVVCVSSDGHRALLQDAVGTFVLLDLESQRFLHRNYGRLPSFLNDDRFCLMIDGWNGLVCKAVDSHLTRWRLPHHNCKITTYQVDHDESVIATGCDDGTVWLWNVETRGLLFSLPRTRTPVKQIALSASGNVALILGCDGSLAAWNFFDGKCLAIMNGPRDKVISVCLTPDGQWAFGGDSSGRIVCWNIPNERSSCPTVNVNADIVRDVATVLELTSLCPVTCLALSRDGHRLLAGGDPDDANRVSGAMLYEVITPTPGT